MLFSEQCFPHWKKMLLPPIHCALGSYTLVILFLVSWLTTLVISLWGRGLFLSEFPLPYTIFPKSSQIIWLILGHLLNYLDCLASPWKFWWSSSELRPRNLVVSTSIPGDPYHQARLENSGPACSNTKNMWLSELKKLHMNRTFFCLFRSGNHQI